MKKTFTLLFSAICFSSMAQTTLTNGDFELWGNATPGVATEPTGWYSNKSGTTIAALGPQTCFKDSTTVHGGRYSAKVVTASLLGTAVNGALTTGVVCAPTTTKSDGYIGTAKYGDTTDVRRMNLTGRPDSLVGWYQYAPAGAGEMGKVRAILHKGQYFDPETGSTYHADPSANKIADLTFNTPASAVTTWTRFSMPFNYVDTSHPSYIMINITSSANQSTSVTGSILWIDDVQVVYKPTGIAPVVLQSEDVNIYSSGKNIFVDYNTNNNQNWKLSVYDMSGRLVKENSFTGGDHEVITLGDVTNGVYIYRLSHPDFSKTGKISIQ